VQKQDFYPGIIPDAFSPNFKFPLGGFDWDHFDSPGSNSRFVGLVILFQGDDWTGLLLAGKEEEEENRAKGQHKAEPDG